MRTKGGDGACDHGNRWLPNEQTEAASQGRSQGIRGKERCQDLDTSITRSMDPHLSRRGVPS